ncbi:unnamed protein product [Microthlaspi erraticum]|uniref:Uncharacterized protein n=1 Tax=Microthlaspi erraticum TaxID=1685480 RepID=A0A6D2I9A8_9BRAS|nr:unnamed protein product [Microthlaspi erraticum]
MSLEVCNLDEPFRRYHVFTEDWSTAGRTHSAGQKRNWLRSAFTRTHPDNCAVQTGRQWTMVDPENHITADHIAYTVDPSSANKKPTYAVSTILGPFHLNRLVEDLGHYKYSFLASIE